MHRECAQERRESTERGADDQHGASSVPIRECAAEELERDERHQRGR
jgi:hypothetical protein